MLGTTLAADLALAHALADAADAVTASRYRAADLTVAAKPDATPVTDADRAAEEAVRALLRAERPGDAVVGEELGEHPGSAADGSGRRWIVDPIDGTGNYVRGMPVWGTLLALEEDGEIVAGVVSAPALGRRWWASRGGGAWVAAPAAPAAAERCRVSAVDALDRAYVSCSSYPGGPRAAPGAVALLALAGRSRGLGDFWSHVLVAEGAVDVAFESPVALWDLAPLQVIVEEAGGRFTDLAGRARPDGGSAVSSNGVLHDAALRVLAGGAA